MAEKNPGFTDRLNGLALKAGYGERKYKKLARDIHIPYSSIMKYMFGVKDQPKGFVPESQHLIVLADFFNVSIDWLLTSKEFAKLEPQDNETRQAMEAVKEIMASKHDIVIPALQANLAAFKCTVRIDKENKQGEKENKKIKKENRSLRKDVDILGRKVDRLDHLNNPRAQGATGTESGTDT